MRRSQIARIDLTMQLGAVSESVEVQAAAPLLESNSSAVGQVVESKVVSDLPLNRRNFAQLRAATIFRLVRQAILPASRLSGGALCGTCFSLFVTSELN